MDRSPATSPLLWIVLAAAVLLAHPGAARAGGVLQTEPAELLPYGKAELQAGSIYSSLNDGDELWVIPSTRFRLGLGGVSEFFVNLQTARLHSETGGMEGTGLRLFDLGTKFALDGRGPGETARDENLYSFYFRAKIPSADKNKGLGEDKTDLFGRFLASGELGEARYDLNLGVGILQKAAESSGQDDILTWGAALDYPVSDSTGVLLEAAGRTNSTRHPGETQLTAGLRFGDRFGKNLQLGVRRGFGNSDEDWAALASYQLPLGLFGDGAESDGQGNDCGNDKSREQDCEQEREVDESRFYYGEELKFTKRSRYTIGLYEIVEKEMGELAEELEIEKRSVELLLEMWSRGARSSRCVGQSVLDEISASERKMLLREEIIRPDEEENCMELGETGRRALKQLDERLQDRWH